VSLTLQAMLFPLQLLTIALVLSRG
jgi:hypothetical protein